MFSELFSPILKVISGIFVSLATLTGAVLFPQQVVVEKETIIEKVETKETRVEVPKPVGATISAITDFRTSLATGISSSATEMTLASFTSGSETLTQGRTYGFKIGGYEYVSGVASTSNKIVSLTRGLSRITGTTTVDAYKRAWGRGTDVELTDAPLLVIHSNIFEGRENIPAVLRYETTTPLCARAGEICDYTYINNVGLQGAATSTEPQAGIVRLATQLQQASSTDLGANDPIVLQAKNATSTFNSATAGLRAVITQNNGKIDPNFYQSNTHTFTGPNVFNNASNTVMNLRSASAIIGGVQSPYAKKQSVVTNDATIAGTSSSTAFTTNVQAGTLATSSAIVGKLLINQFELVNTGGIAVCMIYGGVYSTTCINASNTSGSTIGSTDGTVNGHIEFSLLGAGTTGSQEWSMDLDVQRDVLSATGAIETMRQSRRGTFSIDSTALQTLTIEVRLLHANDDLRVDKAWAYIIQ